MKEKLKRRLNRLKCQYDDLEKKHNGNELKYTYWVGFNLGYLNGRIAEIENILDEFGENVVTDIQIKNSIDEHPTSLSKPTPPPPPPPNHRIIREGQEPLKPKSNIKY